MATDNLGSSTESSAQGPASEHAVSGTASDSAKAGGEAAKGGPAAPDPESKEAAPAAATAEGPSKEAAEAGEGAEQSTDTSAESPEGSSEPAAGAKETPESAIGKAETTAVAGSEAKDTASHAKEKASVGGNDGGDSDHEDFGSVAAAAEGAISGALEEISLSDSAQPAGAAPVPAAETEQSSAAATSPLGPSRTSSKVPAESHPLQGTGSAGHDAASLGPSPADVATAILSKDSDASRQFGSRAAHGSAETDRTAFSLPLRNSSSPLSSEAGPSARPEIAEAGGIDDMDEVEAYEEHQRHLFKIAEQRRKQKEQVMNDRLASSDVELLRSGLANAREQTSPINLRILNGAFPEGLRGSLYSVGAGRFDINYNVQRELEQATQKFTFGHIMDALPLLKKFTFDPKAKTISYRSRLIAKQLASRIQMEHGVNTKVPGALYHSNTNQTFLNMFIPKSSHYSTPEGECCNQDVQLFLPLQGSTQTIVCTNHVGALQNIDPEDLCPRATVELKDINSEFKGTLSCPHMQYDPSTREYFTVTQDVGFRTTTYSVVAISEAQPQGYVVARFTAQASILHSFAITQDYIIVPVYPYSVPIGGVNYRWSDSLLDTLSFAHGQPVQLYVISREYRRVQCIYQAPAFFALHQINAVQEGATDSVSIDLVAYEDDTILRRLHIKELRNPSVGFFLPLGQARRYQLNGITMEASKFVESKGRMAVFPSAHMLILRPEPVELAQVSPINAAKPYTYLYGLSHAERLQGLAAHMNTNTMYNCIVKLDTNDPMAPPLVWARKGCYPSEPVFVPRSDKEDDGYLVSVFFDSTLIISCLLVLDAQTFEEVTIAELPSAVPHSFGHARFAI